MPKKTREEIEDNRGSIATGNFKERVKSFTEWGAIKKQRSTTVGACMRLSLNPDDKVSESAFDKAIKEYQEGPSGGTIKN